MPAAMLARMVRGRWRAMGRWTYAPTRAAAMAPMSSCPSAPMLNTLHLKATATARPVSITGTALPRVTVKATPVPKAPCQRAP